MIVNILIGMALLVGLPLLGVVLAGQPIQPYLEFPPQTRFVHPTPFSWPIFLGLALMIGLPLGSVVVHMARSRVSWPGPMRSVSVFPWWGWLGAVLTMCSWVLAWNRFPWFAALQP